MEIHKKHPAIHFENVASWEKWLTENHDKGQNIWLIFYKKDSKTLSLTHQEALNMALCYGWIDATINKRDTESYYLFFAKRNPKSNWSRVNKEKIQVLLAANLMKESGLEMVKNAKETGTWDALNEVEKLIVPKDLKIAFETNKVAWENFDAFSRSTKRGTLEWLFNAKKMATRQNRIAKIIEQSLLNKRIF